MTYATLTDVTVRYQPITTMIGSAQYDVSSDDVSSVFIAMAASLVDAYIGVRYAVPLSVVPPLITMVTADLSIHAMLAEKTPAVPEYIDKRYQRCIDILESLRDGTMTLGSSVTALTSGDNFAWSRTMNYHPIFDAALNPEEQRLSEPEHDAAVGERADDIE